MHHTQIEVQNAQPLLCKMHSLHTEGERDTHTEWFKKKRVVRHESKMS